MCNGWDMGNIVALTVNYTQWFCESQAIGRELVIFNDLTNHQSYWRLIKRCFMHEHIDDWSKAVYMKHIGDGWKAANDWTSFFHRLTLINHLLIDFLLFTKIQNKFTEMWKQFKVFNRGILHLYVIIEHQLSVLQLLQSDKDIETTFHLIPDAVPQIRLWYVCI
jgi:hypothetical protein